MSTKAYGADTAPLRAILRKTIWKNVLFNASIAVLVLVLLVPVYRMSYQSARETVQTNLEHTVTANVQMLAADFRALDTYLRTLMQEPALTYVAYLPDRNGLHISKAIELHRHIVKSFVGQDKIFDDMLILFADSRYVISKTGVHERDSYYGPVLRYEGLTGPAFEDLLLAQRALYLPEARLFTDYFASTQGAVALNYYSKTTTRVSYVISVMIQTKNLLNRLVPPMLEGAGFMRFYRDGALLCAYSAGNEDAEALEPILLDGRYRVEYGISSSVYQASVQNVARMLGFYCLAALAAAIGYSCFIAVRTIRPLREFLRLVQGMNGAVQDAYVRDLIQYVRQCLQGIHIHAHTMEGSIQKLRSYYKETTLQSLLHGVPVTDQEALRLLAQEASFQADYVLVELLFLNQDAAIVPVLVEQAGYAKRALLVEAPAAQLLSSNPFLWVLPVASFDKEALHRLCSQLSSETASGRVVVSAPHMGLEALHTAHEEIRSVMRSVHPFLAGGASVIEYDMLPMGGAAENRVNPDHLVLLLSSGKREDLDLYMEAAMRHMSHVALTSPQRVSACYYAIIQIYESVFSSLGMDRKLREFDPESSFTETEVYLSAVALDLHEQMASKREKVEPHEGIIRYINENYCKSQMSLSFLSEKFSLSEAYVSRIVKRATGMSYAEFVESLRMRQAIADLLEEEIPIGDLAFRLGYDNPNTFFKAFKRRYGVSPGTYRAARHAIPGEEERAESVDLGGKA